VAPKTPNLVILRLQDCEAKPTSPGDDRSGASQNSGISGHHQDNDERECSDQVLKKDGTAKRRTENDLAAAAFFSRMCLFDP
jgi:hypothetical protein